MSVALGAGVAGVGVLAYCNAIVGVGKDNVFTAWSSTKGLPLLNRIGLIAAHLLRTIGTFLQAYFVMQFGAGLWMGLSLYAAADFALAPFLMAQVCFIGAQSIAILATRHCLC